MLELRVENAVYILCKVEPGTNFGDQSEKVTEKAVPRVRRMAMTDPAETLAWRSTDDPMNIFYVLADLTPQIVAAKSCNVRLYVRNPRKIPGEATP